jgi:hypothetical protein
MPPTGHLTRRALLLAIVVALAALTIAAFVLAHVGAGHGITQLP